MKKKTEKTEKKGTLSVEHLHHFRCGECNKWWSIGDPKAKNTKEWYCPWCGLKQKFNKTN